MVLGAASRASEAPPIATMTALPGLDSSSTIVSRLTSHMPCMRQNSLTTGVMKFQDIVPATSLCAVLFGTGRSATLDGLTIMLTSAFKGTYVHQYAK